MANQNKKLAEAKAGKKDEFYTQLSDIENELRHYKKHFEGKTIFCNCDDPYESNFFKYFALNFNALKLKKLISVSYTGSPIVTKEFSLFEDEGQEIVINNKRAYKVVMTELKDVTGDGRADLNDVKEIIKHRIRYLKGDGSFQSEESIELLKEADIVVTNPPFSLFREYIAQLMIYEKKFIVIGHQNAITYKEFFPLLKDNKVWLGYGFKGGAGYFINNHYEDYAVAGQHKEGMIRVSGVVWFTNLDIDKRHDPLDLYKEYSEEEYPKYDNYDAINVDKTADIPLDYEGVMGVPITFLDKYCPEQFEILGLTTGREEFSELSYPSKRYINAIQHNPNGTTTSGSKANTRACLVNNNPKGVYYTADNANGKLEIVYARILIRRKKVTNSEN